MPTRQLFPHLPAEVRNEIYSHLCTSPATTNNIPLPLKTYTSSHITVQICAIHRGSSALLALRKYGFQEGNEFNSWLLGKGTEIWIGVRFAGHLHTFIQAHWDTKISASLRKLAKQYPWVANVAKYEIKVLWEPKAEGLKRCPRGISGLTAKNIVKTLTGMQNPKVTEKTGDVKVELCVGSLAQLVAWRGGLHLGLSIFLSGASSGDVNAVQAIQEIREVRARPTTTQRMTTTTPWIDMPSACKPSTDNTLIAASKNGRVSWTKMTEGELVMRKVWEGGVSWGESPMQSCEKRADQRVWKALGDECAENQGVK